MLHRFSSESQIRTIHSIPSSNFATNSNNSSTCCVLIVETRMQLRSGSSNLRGSGEEQHNGAQRRRSVDDEFLEDLPLYHRRSAAVRRDSSRSRSPEKWIHVIPLLVLLCFFFLWWFSFPVHVDVKDGRITSIKPIGPPLPPNDTRIDFTILAAATASSPIPLFPQNLLGEEEDETYFPPASSPNN